MLILYNSVLLPLRGAAELAARRPGLSGESRRLWRERLARDLPGSIAGGLWIHGASVGETAVSTALGSVLRERFPALPLAMSSSTESGRERLAAGPVRPVFLKPLDFAGLPGRVLRSLEPAGLVLVETELWPNLVHEAARNGIRIVVVNGRLSAERMSRYRRFGRLFRPLLESLERVGARSEEDAARFLEAGLPGRKLVVTGDLKYDLPSPLVQPDALRKRFGLGDRPVVVAGSTRPGEEEQVVDAFVRSKACRKDLYLVLAPRHPERAGEAGSAAAAAGLTMHSLAGGVDERAGLADGLLVDAIGELAALYGVAVASFVGGTLVPVGGHNVLEPANAGSPVLFGPHTGHVEESAGRLLRAGGAVRVSDAQELADGWIRLLEDRPGRDRMASAAEGVVVANRGAMDRTLSLLRTAIPSPRWEGAP